MHEQIDDPAFRRAVDLLDAGDADGLRTHLSSHPGVVHQRVSIEPPSYFSYPTLLEFAAENPARHGRLPANIVEVAKVVLDAGAGEDKRGIDSALALVCSGKVPRECDVQVPLIDLLCDRGADPNAAILSALAHDETDAVVALLRRGANIDLTVAAATGQPEIARQCLASASAGDRHRALALAAQYGHVEIVRMLVDAGEDPNRYNPPGCHPHSTPLHQAALHGRDDVVRLLTERGARIDTKDSIYHGTPLDWTRHEGRKEIEEYLSRAGGS